MCLHSSCVSLHSSRVSLHCSRVSHGIPPLLQVDLRQLNDDLKSFRMTSTDLGSIHCSMTSLHSSRECSPLSVVSLYCSRESFGCRWVTLQCSRLTLYGPSMCNSGFRIELLWLQNEPPQLQGEPPRLQDKPCSSRMILHCSRVNLHCSRGTSTNP